MTLNQCDQEALLAIRITYDDSLPIVWHPMLLMLWFFDDDGNRLNFVQVRTYTADGVVGELEKSKMDYLQASIVVTSTKRILIPHLLHSNMHDFARDLDSLVDWIVNQLPTSWPLRKSMLECLKGRTTAKISHTVDVIPNNSEFQYLLPMWLDLPLHFFSWKVCRAITAGCEKLFHDMYANKVWFHFLYFLS